MTLYGFFLFSSLYFILLYFFSWGKSSYIKCYLLVKEKKKKKQLQGQRWKCWQCHSLTMLCDSATSAWNKLFNTLSEKLKVAKHDSQELVTRKKKEEDFFIIIILNTNKKHLDILNSRTFHFNTFQDSPLHLLWKSILQHICDLWSNLTTKGFSFMCLSQSILFSFTVFNVNVMANTYIHKGPACTG